ncbi:hypothetical protein ACFSX9_02770 [Flavobacterium ardleyense]|uniref:Uncharacterized protein n=1 Tax=Flavobacterium ardleyense TaxID=2038737 RepID=A0ABW5Z499_9FLAO
MTKYIILLLFPICCFSQIKITGNVKNDLKENLYGVSVVINNIDSSNIIAYDITDDNGNFEINVDSNLDKFTIEVQILGYKKEIKIIDNINQRINYTLVSEITILKEVILKTSPITKKGDTLSYNVASFASEKDRTIADVLSKMPGIEVMPDGKILYQGKPINKYYIEGMDLLEGKYNLANNNLPFSQVAKVQILENHQPVRVLDSLVYSDNAALNIKLKNSVSFTGQAELGIGLSPILWENNLTPMLFTKNRQFLTSYQSNNTGNDVSSQLETLTLEDLIESVESNSDKKDWLAIQRLNTPSFSEKRWLDNNIHLITANYLQKLKKNLELRVNISYLNDYQQQKGATKTLFFTQNDTIAINEVKYNRIYNNSLQTNLTVQKNTKENYFKNSIQYQGYWDNNNGLISTNNLGVNQNLNNHYYTISNKFKNIFSLGKQLLTVNSYFGYNRTPQILNVNPGQFDVLLNNGVPYDNLKQNVDLQNINTSNSISFTKALKQFTITPKFGVNVENQNLDTALFIEGIQIQNNEFYNELDWFKSKLYIELQTQYKKNNWRLEFNSPLNFNYLQIKDYHLDKREALNKVTFEPRISVVNDINSFWKISSSAGFKNKFGSIDAINYAYILKNYRNIQRNNSIIPQTYTQTYNIGISYRNPLTSLFGNLFYSYSVSNFNLINKINILNNGSIELEAIEQSNIKKSSIISGNVNKYISTIKTNFKLSSSWSSFSFNQFLNNQLAEINSQNSTISIKSNTDILKWFDLEYQAKWNISKSKVDNQSKKAITNQSHLACLNLYPLKNHYIGLKTEYFKNNLFATTDENLFADLIYRYTWKSKKIDFEVQYNNIFNTNEFQTVNVDSFSYVETSFALRPSQVLFKVRFTL